MQKTSIDQSQMILAGLATRTNTRKEMDPTTASIGALVNRYFTNNIAAQIPECKNPMVTICGYYDYESDANGDYNFFIGEAVSSAFVLPTGFTKVIIPEGKYQKFTTEPGVMPQVEIEAWQQIWAMTESELGGKRNYLVDFVIYNQRATDNLNTIVDIYIGIA